VSVAEGSPKSWPASVGYLGLKTPWREQGSKEFGHSLVL